MVATVNTTILEYSNVIIQIPWTISAPIIRISCDKGSKPSHLYTKLYKAMVMLVGKVINLLGLVFVSRLVCLSTDLSLLVTEYQDQLRLETLPLLKLLR
jgi:hypothetical protein